MKTMQSTKTGISRRQFITGAAAGAGILGAGWLLNRNLKRDAYEAETFIHRVPSYAGDLRAPILAGFRELGIGTSELRGKKILLKPNLVEPHVGRPQINTNPLLVRAAVEAFLSMGAAQVAVAEGPGHRTDTMLVLDESGIGEVLSEDRIQFIDLNYDAGVVVPNKARQTSMPVLTFPRSLTEFDWLVSMPKMKTHHWVGVTLAMKNLFGLMPGIFYGWPKNVFHMCGIQPSILDINAAAPAQFCIVDGIVGMEGDGPIMGDAKEAGVLVMGRNAVAVDATCARVMGIDPHKAGHGPGQTIGYLEAASAWLKLGPINEESIGQRGEAISKVRCDFKLLDHIEAHRGIRLA